MPPAAAIAAPALLGAIGGAISSGPTLDQTGTNNMNSAYGAYSNLVSAGATQGDVSNAATAQRTLAADYGKYSANPMSMFDFAGGAQLANQQFTAQRQQLATSLQQQTNQAQQAAASAGRSVYDPILQSRLQGQAMSGTAALNAQQQTASLNYAQQLGQQKIGMEQNQVNTLQGLANQAFSGQQSLFGMGQQQQTNAMSNAQYQMSQGGGIKGALTGLAGGAGAGMQMAGGMAQMGASNAMQGYFNQMSQGPQSNALSSMSFGGPGSMSMAGGGGGFSALAAA